MIEPATWVLAFHRATPHWWLRWVGTYKHVSAFALVPELRCWLVYEVTLSGTRLVLVEGDDWLVDFTLGADLMQMPVRRSSARPAPFSCVSAVGHLIGAPGCVARPDGLWRWCLQNGGTVIGSRPTAIPVDRSCDAGAAASG